MIRLRLLQAAPLLLLLLQIASIEGKFNKTGCESSKACWLGHECARIQDPKKVKEYFYMVQFDKDFKNYREDCSKYFIVEPGIEDFDFELLISGIDTDKKVDIEFTQSNGIFTCKNQKVSASDLAFAIHDEPNLESQNFFCKFKVTKKTMDPSIDFWKFFEDTFYPINVIIKPEGQSAISVDNYNVEIFKGRVPCSNTIFLNGVLGKEHFTKPLLDVSSRSYKCESNYTMSHKLFTDALQTVPERDFKITKSPIRCSLGKIEFWSGKTPLKVSSAKCARPRSSLCADLICTNCTGLKNILDGGRRTITCEQNFMIVNHNIISGPIATCHDDSTPENHLWSSREFTVRNINEVKCVDKLDCNDITPFDDASCQNCENVIKGSGGIKCKEGDHMIMIDKITNAHHNVTITCNERTGQWLLNYKGGKDVKGTQKEMSKWKLGCEGPKEKEKEKEDDKPVAAASSPLMYVGIGLGALLLILLFILLLYYICCRKGRQQEPPKDESSKPPTPPTQPKTTESSNVEQAVEPPPPLAAPVSTDSEPAPFSGKRVQFINMSKEHLREIEPDDPYKEVSARDKTDSERSKPSQMSQVGGTTVTGTVTGRQTEKTNEMSKTVANADDSRSDVSNGRGNSTLGDNSQTGGGGSTPTIGDAAKKKERKGPRVAFRERVSYETDPTKTRDKSSVASMHTAPEQPWPAVDTTQPEGSTVEGKRKDDPSRLNAESARKAFGTRTTQNSKETNEQSSVAGNRSASRVTDISRTG